MNIVIVGVGGMIGSTLRFFLDKHITQNIKSRFPVGIFIINILGAFLLGLVLPIIQNNQVSLFFITGLLGSFTTFSTFALQIFNLGRNKEYFISLLYLILSIVWGIVFFSLGMQIGIGCR